MAAIVDGMGSQGHNPGSLYGEDPMNRRFLAAAALLLALGACHDTVKDDYDLVIRGGTIADGSGAPGFAGDVAIRGDRIAAVGVVSARGRSEIDARGLIVAPGFIDMHSHSDYLLLEEGAGQSKIRQGVTTEVLGEESSGGPSKGKLKPRRIQGDIIHVKIADQKFWGRMKDIVALIEDARRRGVNVQSNIYPSTRGNNNLVTILPPWAHEGGTEKLLGRLRNPADRERMKKDI